MKVCYAIDWNHYPEGEWCPSTYFTKEVRDTCFAARDRNSGARSLELVELTPELKHRLEADEPSYKGCWECRGILGHHPGCPEYLPGPESRFFIDHGIVHDRKTGRHLRGNGEYGDATAEELLAVLQELENASRTET